MEQSILLGGFGGQGVQTLGKLLAYTANDAEKKVTFYPAYGGEMRGGTSNCTVVVSDRRIGAPARNLCDYVLVLNEPSFKRFEPRVKKDGTLFVNSSLIKEKSGREDIHVRYIPLNALAEEVGNPRAVNIILYGYFVNMTGMFTQGQAQESLRARLGKKKEFAEMNERAFLLGWEQAEKEKQSY